MSDPAVEAAQRAWTDRYSSGAWFSRSVTNDGFGAFVVASAREALKPIRELHKAVDYFDADDGSREFTCDECGGLWPCATARLIYTTEELS